MKVIVDYSNIDPTLKENIESHIHAHWRESLISPETKDLPIRKNPSPPALLSIKAEANSAAEESGPLKETIVVGNTSSVDEVLYFSGREARQTHKIRPCEYKATSIAKAAGDEARILTRIRSWPSPRQ